MPPGRKLTPRQERFVTEYLIDLNGKAAAIRAGYAPKQAVVQGVRLVKVCKPYIDAELAKRSKKTGLTAERVLEEIQRLATADTRQGFAPDGTVLHPKDMPEDLARCISQIEVEEEHSGDGVIVKVKRIRFWDKGKALDLAQRHLGVVQKHQLSGPDGGPVQVRTEIDAPPEVLEQIWLLLGGKKRQGGA